MDCLEKLSLSFKAQGKEKSKRKSQTKGQETSTLDSNNMTSIQSEVAHNDTMGGVREGAINPADDENPTGSFCTKESTCPADLTSHNETDTSSDIGLLLGIDKIME